jgi:hypothetical protein
MQCLVESAKLTSQWPILCIRRSICRPRKETYAYPGHVGKGERLCFIVLHFRGTGIQDNLADKAKKLGIPVWKFGAG